MQRRGGRQWGGDSRLRWDECSFGDPPPNTQPSPPPTSLSPVTTASRASQSWCPAGFAISGA